MGKCKKNKNWLDLTDKTGRKISEWADLHASDSKHFFCRVCACLVNIEKGSQALTQHSGFKKHQDNAAQKLDPRQLRLAAAPGPSRSSSLGEPVGVNPDDPVVPVTSPAPPTSGCLTLYSVRDQTTRAELIWTLKCIASNYSAASCHALGDIFQAMFPTAKIEDFSLGRTKASYYVTEALAPYFRRKRQEDIANEYFTLAFDETVNAAKKKELQIAARYWSPSRDEVVTEHLHTYFIGKATAVVLKERLITAMDEHSLPAEKLLSLSRDGPNVNKAAFRLLNEHVKSIRQKSLLDIGSCNIHILHNAFLAGLEELGEDASELIIAVHQFFDGWPSRFEDFTEIQSRRKLPPNGFIKHVTSRWLTLEGAAERFLEQWDAVTEYFLDFIPKKKNCNIPEKAGYKKIVRLLKEPTMKAEILFAVSSARIFSAVTGTFQKEEPMVHLLHDTLETVVKTLIGRACKEQKAFDKVFEKSNLVNLEDVVVSKEVKDELKDLSEASKTAFLKNARKHYVKSCEHTINKSSLQDGVLKSLRCLQPERRISKGSCKEILKVAEILPFPVPSDTLLDEWKLLQTEKDGEGSREGRIDHYWRQFINMQNVAGEPKFPNVSKVVKAALCLAHGNADVERGFSRSGNILTEDRAAMSERMLNGYLDVKCELMKYKNLPHLIPMTTELLAMARSACGSYKTYLEENRKLKEKEKQKQQEEEEERRAAGERKRKLERDRKKLEEEETTLKRLRKEEDEVGSVADKLYKMASDKLKKAVESKDLDQIALAQGILEGAMSKKADLDRKKKQVSELRSSIDKMKNRLLDK